MTYKRIIFGTDGSERAAHAGAVAIALAKAGSAELIVAHAFESAAGADERLAAAVGRAEEAGVKRLSGELRAGSPVEALAGLAEERDAGLLVISGGRGQRYTLGNVAQRLSHVAPCDLLIVGESSLQEDPPYRHLLIATDGSATADRAARKGFDLAESLGAQVTMVFVGHPATGKLVTDDTLAVYAGDVPTDVLLLEGEPAVQILDAADQVRADLIVVGNKGMTGAKRFLIGSVPQKVSEYTTQDLLITRTVVQAVSELAPGDGGIVEQQGEKLAAYMEPGGELYLMSARCTHMGCTVAWNPGERTFDCPCHGSRFGPDGAVVNGPAARPLAPA